MIKGHGQIVCGLVMFSNTAVCQFVQLPLFTCFDFRRIDAPVDFEELIISGKNEVESIENAIIAVKRNGVALKGNIHTDASTLALHMPGKSHNVKLR